MAHLNLCGAQPRARNLSTPPLSSIAEAVRRLQNAWYSLPDFERAHAVLSIIRAGVSRRALARALNIHEATVRNILLILEADEADLASFRRGAISRNELIRRIRGTSPAHPDAELKSELDASDSDKELTSDPAEVCREILSWLATDESRSSNACLALWLALVKLEQAIKIGALPRRRYQPGTSTEEIIRSSRPKLSRWATPPWWYAEWILNWVICLIPNPGLCRDALKMAFAQAQANGCRPSVL